MRGGIIPATQNPRSEANLNDRNRFPTLPEPAWFSLSSSSHCLQLAKPGLVRTLIHQVFPSGIAVSIDLLEPELGKVFLRG